MTKSEFIEPHVVNLCRRMTLAKSGASDKVRALVS